ncbi:type IV secretory system conjugative DNA transfer family protein [Bifidobacterium xylocopae]|uniref:type IV secretory system conjugative DNA transfer family protein n=1 Tax=Bifidobacterium xylocopae TaxID=2493119 RepID=UPI00137529D2|nr:TraM recognition domain-containing protein [Bifidobacterium xylocopae]
MKQPSGIDDQTAMRLALLVLVLGGSWVVWLSWMLGCLLRDGAPPAMRGLFSVPLGLASGKLAWPGIYGWVVLGGQVVLYLGAAAMVVWRRSRRRRRHSRVDAAARHLGVGSDIEPLSEAHAAEVAGRLGVESDRPGLAVGRHVLSGEKMYMSWEDMLVCIAGPRTGKTTCLAIPSILDAPGPVLTTSNKRDIIDGIRGPRSRKGVVWPFDPQKVSNDRQTWWWNPLTYVRDETKALQLAGYFASSSIDADAKKDAFFDSMAESLISYLLLAASLKGDPITEVWTWLMHSNSQQPVDVLQDHGYDRVADSLQAIIESPDKQKQGVYGSAQNMARVLTSPQVTKWVTPPSRGHLDEFDVRHFVGSDDTLCSMSREGVGNAGAFVLALTAAVSEAAEEKGAAEPGGHLHKPLLDVLDEAANVCRWRELPDLYSHYGSRCIVMQTYLQSWSQGCTTWGDAGMSKLWSATNLGLYLGGVREADFLRKLSELVGEFDYRSRQVAFNNGQTSSTVSLSRDSIMSVDELAALPRGRELLLASGARPALLRTMPWMERPDADEVRTSLAMAQEGSR